MRLRIRALRHLSRLKQLLRIESLLDAGRRGLNVRLWCEILRRRIRPTRKPTTPRHLCAALPGYVSGARMVVRLDKRGGVLTVSRRRLLLRVGGRHRLLNDGRWHGLLDADVGRLTGL